MLFLKKNWLYIVRDCFSVRTLNLIPFAGKWLSEDVAVKKILDTDGMMMHTKEFQ